jgi:raffinose/stachyose/melibiose transport system substrate-binding protein
VKRLATVLCGLALLAGCGDDPQTGKKVDSIDFWHIQTKDPMKSVVAAAASRAELQYLKVKVTPIENDAFKNKLRLAMPAGNPPDVFHTWGGGMLAADARTGKVMDISKLLEKEQLDRFSPAALDFCRTDGKLYAVPADLAAVVFWYNKETFASHAVAPPKTWKEMLAVCAKLKTAGVTPIALGNSDSWPGAFFLSYFALRLGGKQPFADAAARKPGGSFQHQSFLKAGAMVRDLAKSGHLSGGFNGRNYTQMRGEFFSGKAAMILMGPWILGNARKEAPKGFVAKMACFAFPAVEGGRGDASLVLGGVNAAYAVSARCAQPIVAGRLLKELVSDETARAWAKTGRIPALRSKLVAPLLPPETRGVAEILGAASAIQLYYDQALSPELAQLHKSTTQGLFAGTKTPEKAARLMEEKAKVIAVRGGK